ncbi:MAG TPA: CBS domain-containing protein [Dissulfurispiraceae bacterium]|nr:CBS domain-containing protein [Dissulfurispiraceae bacterium]
MLKARDIMTTDVITVRADTTVTDLARILTEHRISGAPVVNDEGRMIGIVTENGLIRRNRRFHIPTVLRILDAFIPLETEGMVEKEIRELTASTVGEICARDVVTVGEDATVEDIATIMAEIKVHLIPVVKGDGITGIIGKMDLVRSMAGRSDQA